MPSLWCDEALLPTGWARSVRLVLDGTRIAAVEPGAEPAAADERQAIVLPGMANLHSHAFQRGIAGLTERRGPHTDTFWTWRAQMYRFLERLDADAVEAIAAMAYVEMLESGYTRVGEFHYLHHDIGGIRYANLAELAQRIAAAAQETGIGLALLPVFYAHSGFGGREPHDGQKRFVTDIEEFLRLLEDCRLAVAGLPEANAGIAPHSLRAVTRAQLVCLAASAGEGPIHIHVAEQIQEVEECLAWSGRRPVQWLLDEFGLDARWCLIHATHMTDEEAQRLAASGALVGLCPITEANLGDGIFNAAFIRHGGRYGIGTDSNVMIGLPQELCQLEYAQRLHSRQRNVLVRRDGISTGRQLFDDALYGGAAALQTGEPGLRAGSLADIVTIDPAKLPLNGLRGDTILDAIVFAAKGSVVDTVWCLGRKVVADGRHVAGDRIRQRFLKTVRSEQCE